MGNRTYDRDHLKAPRAVLTPSGADLDVVSTRGDELIVHPREEKDEEAGVGSECR